MENCQYQPLSTVALTRPHLNCEGHTERSDTVSEGARSCDPANFALAQAILQSDLRVRYHCQERGSSAFQEERVSTAHGEAATIWNAILVLHVQQMLKHVSHPEPSGISGVFLCLIDNGLSGAVAVQDHIFVARASTKETSQRIESLGFFYLRIMIGRYMQDSQACCGRVSQS